MLSRISSALVNVRFPYMCVTKYGLEHNSVSCFCLKLNYEYTECILLISPELPQCLSSVMPLPPTDAPNVHMEQFLLKEI